MKVNYYVTYDNGDYRTVTVDEPIDDIEKLSRYLEGIMRDYPVVRLGTTVLVVRHVRSITLGVA